MANRKALARRAQFTKLGETNTYGNCPLVLFPNGEEGEIWVSDGCLGLKIKVNKGPRGLSVTVQNHAGTMPLSCNGKDANEFTVVQYHYDEKAQAFKNWYLLDSESPLDSDLTAKQLAKTKEMFALGKLDAKKGYSPATAHRTKLYQNAYERGFWAEKAEL